jgi:PAS domain S-box-containing protein
MTTGQDSELRQSEERFRLVVEGVRDYAIFLLGPDGRVASWNAGAERIMGYHADEIVGRHFSAFYPPEDVAAGKPDRELAAALAEGRFEDEGWRLRKDGSRFWADAVITPLRDTEGRPAGFVKVERDLTERRAAEERARELAGARAAHAEAEAASRRKDEMLRMLAHELRSPLAPILTALPALRQADDRRARDEGLDLIERQARHLGRLVGDLLDTGLLSRGQVELRRERLDLARLVRVAAGDRRRELEQKGLTLSVEAPETPVWAVADEARLTQVLANLLDNARKFTDRGGVTVRLEAGPGQAVLRVRDTGIGVPAGLLPHLFEPLTQAGLSLARTRGGLGLGLTAVRLLVQQHGGRVEASSPGEGRGTEVMVTLPAEAEPPALSAPPPGGPAAPRRLRVVVVEDNRDAADSLRLLLEILGYEARVAYTGPEGLATAMEWVPDAVLSDVGLPGLDGLGLAAELRRHPSTAGALLVGISGYGSADDRRRARLAGFDHYLVKPADPGVIQEILATRAGAARA